MTSGHAKESTIQRLKGLPRLFRKQDAEKVVPYTPVFLSRAAAKGLITRLNRGNYANSFLYGLPRVEEVACFLRPPAYISCEWALNYHGISLQVPNVCTVVTLSTAVGRRYDVDYQGVRIEFSSVAPDLFFGFETVDNFQMAMPEKAILDTLYLRKGLAAADEMETEHLDGERLRQAAQRYPMAVQRRLAALWDTNPFYGDV